MIEVILCTFNGEKFITEQLDSIRCQTRQADKVSIYDDISTDNTVNIVEEYIKKYHLTDNWNLIINSENKGWRKNFYDAIFLSVGDIVFFSDQDDIWELDKIEIMSKVMFDNDNILKLNSYCTYIDQNDKLISSRNNEKCNNSKEIIQEKFMHRFCGGWQSRLACASAVSRKCIDLLKGIPFSKAFSHDWLLENVMGSLGGSFLINYSSIKHRIHGENTSNKVFYDVDFYLEYGKYIFNILNNHIVNIDKKYIRQSHKFLKFAELRKRVHSKWVPFAWFKLLINIKFYNNGFKGYLYDIICMLHLKNFFKKLFGKK